MARGSKIKKTTKQLAAGEQTKIKAKLKHPKRLKEKANHATGLGDPRVKLRVHGDR